jgi:hypothetical protein
MILLPRLIPGHWFFINQAHFTSPIEMIPHVLPVNWAKTQFFAVHDTKKNDRIVRLAPRRPA